MRTPAARPLPWLVPLVALGLGLACGQSARPVRGQAGAAGYPSQPFRAVVDHVEDGDTLTVRFGSLLIRIRLDGIDAAEAAGYRPDSACVR